MMKHLEEEMQWENFKEVFYLTSKMVPIIYEHLPKATQYITYFINLFLILATTL